MSDFGWLASVWLMRTLLAGGGLFLFAWFLLRFTGDPARRHRLGAWTFRAAVLAAILGVFPAWLTIPIPSNEPRPHSLLTRPLVPRAFEDTPELMIGTVCENEARGSVPDEATVTVTKSAEVCPTVADAAKPSDRPWMTWLLGAYGVLVGLGGFQLLLALSVLMRLRRSSEPAPPALAALVAELSESSGVKPIVRVSTRVATPCCFGWWRPTVLLPHRLVATARPEELRWMLAHEFDHLRRGDPRTGLWVSLARLVYFVVPWFWAVRRELRLAQEYLADAAAAANRRADYAAFLVSLSGTSLRRRAPLVAVAMHTGRTELYRRVSMLTNGQEPIRDGVSRTWSVLTAGGVIAAAVALSGLGIADDKKPEAKPATVEVAVSDDAKPGAKTDDAKPTDDPKTLKLKLQKVNDEVTKRMKEVTAALEKGDIEGAKAAMQKLNEAIATAPIPKTFTLLGMDGQNLQIVPHEARQPMGMTRLFSIKPDEEAMKKLEEKLASLKKALESVKDSPEAREALEKTIAEFKKQLENARVQGQFRIEGVPGLKVEALGDLRLAELMSKQAEDQQRKAIEIMKQLEKKLAAAGDDQEAAKRIQDEIDRAMKEIDRAMADRMFGARAFAMGENPGRFGVTIDQVPESLADQFDLPKNQHLLVTSVREGSPAAKAGLKTNDVLLSFAGKPVPGSADEFVKMVMNQKADEKFDVVVLRKGKKETIKDVTLPAVVKRKATAEIRPAGDKDDEGQARFSSLSVMINNDEFEIKAEGDDGNYRITGRLEDGKAVPEKIIVNDASYSSLDKVPAADRAKVEKLLKNIGVNKFKRSN